MRQGGSVTIKNGEASTEERQIVLLYARSNFPLAPPSPRTLPPTERQWLELSGARILTNVMRPSRVRSAGRPYHPDIDHDTEIQNATIAGSVRFSTGDEDYSPTQRRPPFGVRPRVTGLSCS
jgi:hypothetical protein